MRDRRRDIARIVCALALLAGSGAGHAQTVPDLVSRTSFRVCADPANMPFSDRKLEGFENKIAAIFGDALKRPVHYFWSPSGPGFVRNTLNDDLCDVIMGYTVGAETVLSTNPYYRSTYVIVAPKGSALNGVESLENPKLKGRKLGVFGGSPPVDVMSKLGMIGTAGIYPLIVDHRFFSPLTNMLDDLKAGKIDAAVVWGPLVGQAVRQSDGALVMTPLLKDVDKPGFSYRISLGVRHDETQWKHTLEGVLRARKADINKVLVDYDVPLIDDFGHLIPPQAAVNAGAPSVQPAADRGERSRRGAGAPPAGFKMPGPAPSNQ